VGIKNISFQLLDYTSVDQLNQTFKRIESNDTIILPEVTHAKHVCIYTQLSNYNFEQLFIEKDGEIYSIHQKGISKLDNDDVKLSILDFISQTEGRIIQTNNKLFEHPASGLLLDYLLKHLGVMQEILKSIRPMKNEENTEVEGSRNVYSIVELNRLNKEQKTIYLGALHLLEKQHLVTLTESDKILRVKFMDIRFREFFSKAGAWLEYYTHRQLKSITQISDINSSVMFVWDDHSGSIKNEVDLLAVTDNQLIAISCKDTHKLVDDYLYEIESHADLLGSEEAIKIIVTTAEPSRHIIERSKLLNVHIIEFTGDDQHFKQSILNIIK
jgi:hypothetical protein